LNNVIAEVVGYGRGGDECFVYVDSKKLSEFGWKGHGGNIPAGFLVGLLCAKLAGEKGKRKVILDLGLQKSFPRGVLFSVVMGCIEGGLDVPCDDRMLPSDEAVEGKTISNFASHLLSKDKAKYERQFSKYLSLGIKPENLDVHVKEVKSNILKKWS